MQRPVSMLFRTLLILGAACKSEDPPVQRDRPADTNVLAPAPAPRSASAVATGPRLGVRRSSEYGIFLTDAAGRALYLLEEDMRGASTCYEMCAVIWPPLLAGQTQPSVADTALAANLLGTVERRGGGRQVTYDGRPLYYYMGDSRPGETRGQHVEDSWGEWYLVSPGGRQVGEEGERGRGRERGRDGG